MTEPQPATNQGLKAAFQDGNFSTLDALGGKRGIIETAAPTLIFMLLFMFTKDVKVASLTALGCLVVFTLIRIFRKEQLSPAISGAIAVVLGAVVALRSGEGSDFYLPGLIINAAYAVLLTLSVLSGRHLVGYIAQTIDARVKNWRNHQFALKTYRNATLIYIALFTLKVLIQAPLYYFNQVDLLGVAKIVMGLPAFALATWLIYLLHQNLIKYLAAEESVENSAKLTDYEAN